MADKSSIEWTDATWNPVTGCTEVSPGCDNCYAKTFAERWRGIPGHHFEQGFDVVLRPERLDQPLRWRRPRRVFVNSMSDLFHDAIPDEFIAQVFGVMAATPQHTYQILTKRHARMRAWLRRCAEWSGYITHNGKAPRGFNDGPESEHGIIVGYTPSTHTKHFSARSKGGARSETKTVGSWPLDNVWLGVSVENQQWADIRIPALLETPAAVRWLSCEPLLGPVDLRPFADADADCWLPFLDWVVVGGESGPGARPMHPDWARGLRDQCTAASVPFFFKQWGEWAPNGWRGIGNINPRERLVGPVLDDMGHREVIERVGKKRAGRVLDGRTWDEYPR